MKRRKQSNKKSTHRRLQINPVISKSSKKSELSATASSSTASSPPHVPDRYTQQSAFLPDDQVVRILSLDAGGVRGIIPLQVLEELESRLDTKPLIKHFDMVAGVSTGSIIAAGLTIRAQSNSLLPKFSVRQVLEKYRELAQHVFTPQCVLKRLVRSKYDARVLYEQLHQLMGDTYLSETLIDVSISAYEIETRTPITFSSHRARIDPRFDYRLVDVVMASCSAPTYFPPYYLQNRTRTQDMWCIDGGVVNSNPCRRVINEALHRYPGVPLTRFLVISIGTGNGSRPIHGHKARRFNTIEWIRPIITIVLDASSVNTHYELCESMTSFTTASSFGYLRLQTRLVAGSIHMDDASQDNLRGLYIDAQRLLVEHSILIQHLVIVLQELDEYASSSASSITSTCESLLLLSETSNNTSNDQTSSSTPENQPCVNQVPVPVPVVQALPEQQKRTTISSIPNYYQFVMRLSDAIVCTNHIGIVTCVNQSALRLFEYSSDTELIGRNCKVLIASQLIREHHDAYVEQYTGRHSCTPRTVQALTKNGQQINVLLVLSEQWINANERIFIALFNNICKTKHI